MRIFFPILLLTLTFLSCKKDNATNEGEIAYFGGEIINPVNKHLTLHKSKKLVDTIYLDKNNRFLYKIKNLEEGLYTFRLKAHNGNEFQLALLEANDSVMIRLNTIDFDESLVFTGKGARKNNYLVNMFLDNEAISEKMLGICQLEPKVFETKIDSLREKRRQNLNNFISKNSYSDLFKEIALGNINYNYYISKEIYPFAFYGNNEVHNLQSLPNDFYNYRKDINYNHDVLKDYFTYNTFLRYHFRNLALTEYLKHSKDSVFNRDSYKYYIEKLKLIDSLVKDEDIKNPLLSMSSINYINKTKDLSKIDKLLEVFYQKSTDEANIKHFKELASSLRALKIGNTIPNVTLVNYNNQEVTLHQVIKKPTAIYFWSKSLKPHVKESHLKVQDLKNKYPEVDFISINIDKPNTEVNKLYLKQFNFNTVNEYQLKDANAGKQALAVNPIIKVILITKNGKIIDPHTNLFSVKFEEELLGLLNQ
ncbi:thioredoxin-like domain-containing protein [Oceanihabitans sediminis]|uniref:Thioredoxin domain-containing protein n=1 Tax=Oceanihabitans sediminis TaxID=1812012 RepID=A0A368P466_9FLAO|nr:thioredoxin-like domain-containing protein [Oceanihabitans sediminis]MDX1277873.1 thioredoxin-like domain-containing protein [Oceanihabitans sediminis]MDX1774488.1 thioredoxin-like domain-containing protein [Oceanihabitans sediminis]RBP27774.1 thioredoxin-like protein [Oceanihabitans sediminis]RCU56559.1 hypothetical protein DU428_11730 [Oceanihabitans sediminis]